MKFSQEQWQKAMQYYSCEMAQSWRTIVKIIFILAEEREQIWTYPLYKKGEQPFICFENVFHSISVGCKLYSQMII